MDKKILLIEGCNYIDFPTGGQLSFARQMMKAFGNRLSLVGVSTDDTPVGKWVKKQIDGIQYDYFAFTRKVISINKPFIPVRISNYFSIKKYQKQIMSLGIQSAFIQAPELLIAVERWGLQSTCYRFPGVSNPLRMSRYSWGKLFADIFEKRLFSTLEHIDLILASADDEAIADLVNRSNGRLTFDRVIKFPTRVDTTKFKPLSKDRLRSELGIKKESIVIVSCGRLNLVKGWDLLLQAFTKFKEGNHNAKIIFVGDGEDRQKFHNKVKELGVQEAVEMTGFINAEAVVKYINASDLCVVGSHKEGWSVAMLEALACGKPIVSTKVSGAKDMIIQGRNGFVVDNRNPREFSKAMESAMKLQDLQQVSLDIADRYALKNLPRDLGKLWIPLA